MNPLLSRLQAYPFEKLRALLAGVTPPPLKPIRLSIGEPQHPTPDFIRRALADHLDGLATYPTTAGMEALHEAMAAWFVGRYRLARLDAAAEVLPVNGSREALFAFAQVVVDASRRSSALEGPVVVSPNPFYQIYDGAALLAGATPAFLNQTRAKGFVLPLGAVGPGASRGDAFGEDALTEDEWRRTQLVYVCSPGNPTGHVLTLQEWQALFDRADRYDFVIASDECYSEIYDESVGPPLGALEAATSLGRPDFNRLVVFTSLSKRSNAPGLRSGAVAGDARLLRQFLLYRTYHGCAMSPSVQYASIAAWSDEAHVRDNRVKYRAKFEAVTPRLAALLDVQRPDAGFYLWAGVPARFGGDDERFARELYGACHVTVLPGRYLARDAFGVNPGRGFVRIALVPELDECLEATERIVGFCQQSLP